MSKAVPTANPPSAEGLTPPADRETIDLHLRESLDEARRHFGANPQLGPIFGLVSDFVLQGGKRLRPRLCLASYRIIAGRLDSPPRPVWSTAASLEIFHAFMLVHDDIIDRSTVRRDLPTLPERFRLEADAPSTPAAHRRAGDLSLLSGDLLCALAMRLVARAGLDDAILGRVTRLLADMLVETGLGEMLDVVYEDTPLDRLDEEPLVETYLRKTARYTVSGPLVLGATIAGAGPKVCHALDHFGDLLGFGFQIQNDLDSLAEDVEHGDHADLDGGKRTYVLWSAYQRLGPHGRRDLSDALHAPPSVERRRRLIALIESSGAIGVCQSKLARLQREAVAILRDSPLTATQRRSYIQLVEQFRLKPRQAGRDYASAHSVLPLVSTTSDLSHKPNPS